MRLTEEQIANREQLFLEILEELASELPEPENPASEEDFYILSVVMEHFVENYREPTLIETIRSVANVSWRDPNAELYEEIYEVLLDESVGSMIAAARHGVQGMVANVRKKMAQSKAASMKTAASAAKAKADVAAKKAKAAAGGKGIIGAIKSGFYKAKAAKAAGKAQAAGVRASQAATARDFAANRAKAVQTRRTRLASKIDTGISNVKKKVKSAITTGAERVGAAAGRMA